MFSDFRFLRQRHEYLTKSLMAKDRQNEEDIHDVPIGKEMNCNVTEVLSLLKLKDQFIVFNVKKKVK